VDKREISIKEAVNLAEAMKPGEELTVSGLRGSSRAFLLASFFRVTGSNVLAVLSDTRAALRYAEDLRFFLGPESVFFFPSMELLPFSLKAPHPSIISARMELYHRLADGAPFVTVTTARCLMRRIAPAPALEARVLRVITGEDCPREEFLAELLAQGFRRVPMVEERGEMSVRGAIVDIFPAGGRLPLRLEFFGDMVESIRSFNTGTQRSVNTLKEVLILPASEAEYNEEARAYARKALMERAGELALRQDEWQGLYRALKEPSPGDKTFGLYPLFHERLDILFDHLPEDSTLFIPDRPPVIEALESFAEEIKRAEEGFVEKKVFYMPPPKLYASPEEVLAGVKP